MMLLPDQQRVCTMLKDTITLLCKNGLTFKSKFCVEATIGVTLDDESMFYISMNEIVKSPVAPESDDQSSEEEARNSVPREHRKRKKRPRVKREGGSQYSSNEGSDTSQGFNESSNQDFQNKKIKGEPSDDEGDIDNDIVFVKQELDENWSQSCSQGATDNFPAFRNTSQDNSLSSLSNMTLIPMSPPNNTRWPMPTSARQYRPRMPQSTVTSISSPGAAFSPNNSMASPTQHSQHSQQLQQSSDGQQLGTDQQQSSSKFADWVCPLCGKRCSSRTHRLAHEKRHYGIYAYHCHICNKGFMNQNDRQGHMSWHTGVKEYKCHSCDKEFRYKQHLARHIKSSHSTVESPRTVPA